MKITELDEKGIMELSKAVAKQLRNLGNSICEKERYRCPKCNAYAVEGKPCKRCESQSEREQPKPYFVGSYASWALNNAHLPFDDREYRLLDNDERGKRFTNYPDIVEIEASDNGIRFYGDGRYNGSADTIFYRTKLTHKGLEEKRMKSVKAESILNQESEIVRLKSKIEHIELQKELLEKRVSELTSANSKLEQLKTIINSK